MSSVTTVARPAKFSSEQILDGAARLVSTVGPGGASIGAIAKSLGAPTGSIYHRFDSRDLLMARLWVRTVMRAQQGFVEKLGQTDVRVAAHDAALHIPRWCRTNITDATVLLLYRREQLADAWPADLGADLERLNDPLVRALRQFAPRLPGRSTVAKREALTMALIDVPYGASRRHLSAGKPPPPAVDALVLKACDALLFDG